MLQQFHDVFREVLVWSAQHELSVAILIVLIFLTTVALWCGCIPFWPMRRARQSSVWLALNIIPPGIVVWKRVNLHFSRPDSVRREDWPSYKRKLKDEMRKRFLEREILSLTRIKHAHRYSFVVKLVSIRRKSYSMEHIRGKNLAQWLASFSDSNLSWDQALAVFLCIGLQICKGLQALHECNATFDGHRDLKLGNVMAVKIVLPPEGRVHIKIIDMGTVKMSDGTLVTGDGTGLCSKFYGAPECWEDAGKADSRADVFSLCAILWRLITYFAKVERDNEQRIFDRLRPNLTYGFDGFCNHLRDTLARTLRIYASSQSDIDLQDINGRLEDVIGRGLSVEPEQRPGFHEFQKKLESIYQDLRGAGTRCSISEPEDKGLSPRPEPVWEDETPVI